MNTAAYILILAILLLGGAIATAGDRIGTKVGKARLSLFNLRPRKTATLITILTGVLISASTLTILFTTSESLRKGLFEYDQTQKKLRSARTELEGARRELEQTKSQKSQVEGQLSRAKSEQAAAQQRLDETNQSLQTVLAELTKRLAQQARTETNLSETQQKLERVEADFQEKRGELEKLQAERQALIEQIAEGRAQIERRDREIAKRDREISEQDREISQQEQLLAEREKQLAERNQLLAEREQQLTQQEQLLAEREKQLAERDELLAERNQLLAERQKQLDERDELLAERETRLQDLATQKAFIEREVQFLERDLQVLKEGTIVLRRNQVLASGVVRILQPAAARQAVDRLLEEANRNAIKLAQPGLEKNNQRAIEITRAEVEEVIARIDDGEDYVVRILSAANYLLGEQRIQVFIDAAQNQVVFLPGDVVATTSVDPAAMSGDQIRERIELLLAASSFRGRRVGIIADTIQIADGRIETLIRFLEQLQQQTQPVDVRAIAADVTYTAGPLKMNLVAVKDGKILFQT